MKKTFVNHCLGAITLIGALQGNVFAESPPLPALGADLTQTSVSGISSGGFMTSQLSTAYSGSIVGAGVIAGGPFYCAGGTEGVSLLQNSLTTCMVPLGRSNAPDAEILFKKAQQFATEGKIDDVANLQKQRVYIFSGSNDNTVKTIVVDQTEKYYKLAGTTAIKYIKNVNAGHSIVTNGEDDVACAVTESPFINNCGFEQSQDILNYIYGKLNDPTTSDKLSGKIVKFNQKEFVKGSRTSMSDEAFAYIPKACETESCKVHIAIHGCLQGAKLLGDKYYTGTGYNEIADTNNFIVLYPQAEPTKMMNPMGCWDFWGYSSEDQNNPNFYTKDAPQMSAIMAMVKRLGEPRQATK